MPNVSPRTSSGIHGIIFFFVLAAVLFSADAALANYGTVSTDAIGNRNQSAKYLEITMTLYWQNSWRNNTNHDALWVFAKYQTAAGQPWYPCTLYVSSADSFTNGFITNPTGYSVGTETKGQTAQIVVPSDQKGCFVERVSSGRGDMNITSLKILWDWGTDGFAATDTFYQVQVFALEMVYIPQGAFYAGDGSTTSIVGQFESATSGSVLQITSEDALTLGGGTAGSLGDNNGSGMNAGDDFNDSTSKTLPAAYPKGYNAFYLMKYELSDGMYVDFLNNLSRLQQNKRVASNVTGDAPTGSSVYVMSSTTSSCARNTVKCPASGMGTTNPIVFFSSFTGTTNYRPDRASHSISWPDLCAFADWAALRPVTELEYEKACRGTSTAVAGEYAWGSTQMLNAATTLSGTENGTEWIRGAGTPATSAVYGNCNTGGQAYTNGDAGSGPLRVGIFSARTGAYTRLRSGAGYYGNMEMSGNLWERVVTVGSASGRAFTGSHGDGILTTVSGYEGNATNTDWPGISNTSSQGVTGTDGHGSRGGAWQSDLTAVRVSDRYGACTQWARDYAVGGRAARTAPNS